MNTVVDLSGNWQLSSAGGDYSLSMAVPGDVHSALQQAGLIPDPYHGCHETVVQWVAQRDWLLERRFTLDEPDGNWYLDVDYLDTVATVYLNDTRVLQTANCFRRYRPSLGDALLAGENVLRIVLHSSITAAAETQAKQPFYIPYHAGNSPIPNGNMLRKPQCHFGWDWNIALAPLGLYGNIALRRMGLAFIEHLEARQDWLDDNGVDLHVTVTLFADRCGRVPVVFELDGEQVRQDCKVEAGETRISHIFQRENPRRWWPAGSGEQALSTLRVSIPTESVSRQIGFRRVELLTDRDDEGRRFAFRVNGQEIFCRGANWIPADALYSRTSPEKTADLLGSAVAAHMNMIRVWGGGFYEHDAFYELCDKLGLMVWQDFMFACHLYPCTEAFLAEVAAEVDYQVRRLGSHPSMVLWCGDNELVGALNWFEASRNNRDRYLVCYDRLNRTIEQTLKQAAPGALWWPSSPSAGYLDYGDAWHADSSGDMHYWSVWHENKPFEDYRRVRPRFCSEFGFQSYPSLPVIRRIAAQKDWNIASPVMELHQKNPGGNARIAATLFRYFRFPKDFAHFVYLSQVQQALAIKTAVEYWRSLKPRCMGTLYWQLNDTWPVASWSSLDYGGDWKVLHYLARRFFQPMTVVAIAAEDGETLQFVMLNDTPVRVGVDLHLYSVTLGGVRTALRSGQGECGIAAAEVLLTLQTAEIPRGCLLFWEFTASNGMSGAGHHAPEGYKALELEPSGVSLDVELLDDGTVAIEVAAEGLGLFIVLESDSGGRYSDNAFDLLARQRRRIVFTPGEVCDVRQPGHFRVYDLHASQALS